MNNHRLKIIIVICFLLAACARAPESDSVKNTSMNQAIEFLEQGKLEEAKTHFKKLSQTKKDKFPAFINLGIIAIQQKDFTNAQEYFNQAHKIKPNSVVVLNHLAIVNRHLKHYKKSEEFYLQAIQQDDSNPDIWYNLGILYELYLGNNIKAHDAYNRYQSLMPKPDPKVNAWIKRLEVSLK